MHKIIVITNSPAPYREKIYSLVSENENVELLVVYCKKIESSRQWVFQSEQYPNTFLQAKSLKLWGETEVHFSAGIHKVLSSYNPDVVITAGFGPVMLHAFLWSKLKRKKHIPFTDGTLLSEKNLSFLHKAVRKLVYRFSDAFLGPSRKSLELYAHYGCKSHRCFTSCLCINNENYKSIKFKDRKVDLLFVGQFIERKMPFFFVEVCRKVSREIPNCKIVVLGSGPLEQKFRNEIEKINADVTFQGFVQPNDLPHYYSSAKLLLFPTQRDCWGVIANEASASGTPVMTCENAGASNELILHDKNGLILPLEESTWAQHAVDLLTNEVKWQKLSKHGPMIVKDFTFERAAEGILNACEYVMDNEDA